MMILGNLGLDTVSFEKWPLVFQGTCHSARLLEVYSRLAFHFFAFKLLVLVAGKAGFTHDAAQRPQSADVF